MPERVDWNQLLLALPEGMRAQCETFVRRSLKRQMSREASALNAEVPASVRAEAVGMWRRMYMKGSSKSATRRMNYERLRRERTYQEIERRLLAAYRQHHQPPQVPQHALHMVKAELAGVEANLPVPGEPVPGERLINLEADYRYCDLLYTYARTFDHEERLSLLTERRTQISHVIMDMLAQNSRTDTPAQNNRADVPAQNNPKSMSSEANG